jgi:hypothetical protein
MNILDASVILFLLVRFDIHVNDVVYLNYYLAFQSFDLDHAMKVIP